MEEWRDIVGYEGLYKVSSFGNIMSTYCKNIIWYSKIRRLGTNIKWYRIVSLYKDGHNTSFLVHRLVCLSFLPNPLWKEQVNHINWIKNDNKLNNLEWCTPKENKIHSYKVLGYKHSKKQKEVGAINGMVMAKKIYQYSLSWTFIKQWLSIKSASRALSINAANIWTCCQSIRKSAGWFLWKYC